MTVKDFSLFSSVFIYYILLDSYSLNQKKQAIPHPPSPAPTLGPMEGVMQTLLRQSIATLQPPLAPCLGCSKGQDQGQRATALLVVVVSGWGLRQRIPDTPFE